MNELNSDNNTSASNSQDFGEKIEAKATLNDMAISVLKGFCYDGRPPEFWAVWLKEALEGVASIPEEISLLAGAVEELAGKVTQTNDLLSDTLQTLQTISNSIDAIQGKQGGKYADSR